MRIIAFLPLIFPILAGCASVKPTAAIDSTRVVIRDSIIFRDSIIMAQLPKESSEARLPDNDTSFLETSIARSAAWIDNGTLFHTLQNKSEPLLSVNTKPFDVSAVTTPSMVYVLPFSTSAIGVEVGVSPPPSVLTSTAITL